MLLEVYGYTDQHCMVICTFTIGIEYRCDYDHVTIVFFIYLLKNTSLCLRLEYISLTQYLCRINISESHFFFFWSIFIKMSHLPSPD